MTQARSLFRIWLATATLICLTSCSQEDSGSDFQYDLSELNEKSVVEPAQSQDPRIALLEIPAPNADAMDSDVAAVVQTSWEKLNSIIVQDGLTPEARAQAYATYGLSAFGNGLALPAGAAFENARILAPGDERWIYFLALMHQYNGKLEKAVTSFEQVLDLMPEDLPTLLRIGKVCFEQAKMQDSEAFYRRVLNVDPQSAAAYYGLGRVSSANGEYLRAVSYFEKAITLQPRADRINYFLGMAWRNLGESEKAKAYLLKHGSNEPNFEDPLFDEISGGESRIGGVWVHMNAGSQAFVEGSYTSAVEQFYLATEDLPDDPRSWQSLGMALNKMSDGEGAIKAYQKALSLSQNNAVINHEIAKLMMADGDSQKAEMHLKQAITIDPRMLDAHTTFAGLLSSTGRQKEALVEYEKALVLDPLSGEIAIALAEILVALDLTDDAVATLAETISINPRDSNVRMAYGLVLADAGQLDMAMTEVRQALNDAEDDDTRGRAHFAIGQVNLRQGGEGEAITSFGSALRLNPRHRAAALELARTFIRVRDYQQALGTYDVFLQNWPDNDGARVEAARVAVMLGNGSKAKSILEVGAKEKSASARLLGTLARLLMLSTESDVKNPEQALKHAQRALAKNQSFQHQETLALCHASAGRFKQAVELQKHLIKEAGSSVTARTRARMGKNLERYRAESLGRLPFDAS